MRDSAVSLFGSSGQLPGEAPWKSKAASKAATIYPGVFQRSGASYPHRRAEATQTSRKVTHHARFSASRTRQGRPPARLRPRCSVRSGAQKRPLSLRTLKELAMRPHPHKSDGGIGLVRKKNSTTTSTMPSER